LIFIVTRAELNFSLFYNICPRAITKNKNASKKVNAICVRLESDFQRAIEKNQTNKQPLTVLNK